MKVELPKILNPSNLNEYFYTALGACGCSELDEMHSTILKLLEWHDAHQRKSYSDLYNEVGVFYLLAGMLDSLGLAEHGISIRKAWLTHDGVRLMVALRKYSAEEIKASDNSVAD